MALAIRKWSIICRRRSAGGTTIHEHYQWECQLFLNCLWTIGAWTFVYYQRRWILVLCRCGRLRVMCFRSKSHANGQNCGSKVHGHFCTTTNPHIHQLLCRIFSPIKESLHYFIFHSTRRTWPLPTTSHFSKLKVTLRGERIKFIADIQKNEKAMLTTITWGAFSKAFDNLYERFKACVDLSGSYNANKSCGK